MVLPSRLSDFMRPAWRVMGCAERDCRVERDTMRTRMIVLRGWHNHGENLFLLRKKPTEYRLCAITLQSKC